MRKTLILWLCNLAVLSAQQEHTAIPDHNQELESLSHLFTRGSLTGHIRSFFMTTLNEGDLKDYYAQAVGGAIRFETAEFHGFHAGVAGIFTYKTFSSDLQEPDPTTGEISKWEYELFDILDPDNFNDLDRLEELYIQYRFNSGTLSYGKLDIEDTPLLNRSDGRMKPFAFKGTWLDLRLGERTGFTAAWLDRISPRSTVEWFDFNEGIGLTNNGFQPDGTEADYHARQESQGVAFVGLGQDMDDWRLQAYHWYIHHLNHTSWLELAYQKPNWNWGLQYSLQIPDGFQKELPYAQRFVQPGENGQVLSSRFSWTPGDWALRAAYTHAFSSGRYLFPRELGRDHFYTSIPRSRLEGFGDADVVTLKGEYRERLPGLSGCLTITHIWGPQTNSFVFNKYDLDAYWQVNTGVHYRFDGFFEGLRVDLLYIYRENLNNSQPEVIFNRSNFNQLNLVANFEF